MAQQNTPLKRSTRDGQTLYLAACTCCPKEQTMNECVECGFEYCSECIAELAGYEDGDEYEE